MDQAFEEALVTGFQPLIETLTLRDPKDRHVLAAAIYCKAAVIVTNDRDFDDLPQDLEISVQSADDFIAAQAGVTAGSALEVAIALTKHRHSLTKSRPTWDEYFIELERKLPQSFAEFQKPEFLKLITDADN